MVGVFLLPARDEIKHNYICLLLGLLAGTVIGLPPVLNFGSPELAAKVVPEVLSGKKTICLAITEAFAGSDVAGLKTTAVKTPDGKHWIVNGTKK
jgi:alkylation response protein AidB-like acyl-CoA dehydrogenase